MVSKVLQEYGFSIKLYPDRKSENLCRLMLMDLQKGSLKYLQFPPLAMISTRNPLFTLSVYVIATEGYCEITFSLNIHVMNLRCSREKVSPIILVKDEPAMPTEA